MRSNTNYTVFLLILSLLSLSFGPCNESLPVYEEPTKVFSGKIEGSYGLTVAENMMAIFFTVRNNFDETFQADAALKGNIEIVSLRDPSVRKTFAIGPANVSQSSGYDRTSGKLTIDPRDSIKFQVHWNLIDDNGRDLKTSFFQYIVDPTCDLRCLAFTEDFSIRGNVTLFKQTGPVFAGPINYSFCFVSNYVLGRCCPPIITSAPCNFRPPQLGKPCFPTYFGPQCQ
ncbi:MAG: hypothetical protein HY276_09410 [Ignavibacteriales bacterium]|nr:hypothetical protein [Ignavibacteriales bacterium]